MNILRTLKYYYFKNIYFKKYLKLVHKNRNHAIDCQQIVFNNLITRGINTSFGKDHGFKEIKSFPEFNRNVPARNYEEILPYLLRIFEKEKNVLWPGLPVYFGKSSGTASGPKYLPITNEHLIFTQFAARYMIANLTDQLGNTNFIGGKVFYQADASVFEIKNGFKCASISAIKSYEMPQWTKQFTLPGKEIDRIENLDDKLKKTIKVLQGNNIKSAVALPVWLSQLLIELERTTGKKFREHFPLFKILFLSGMNYEPYENLIRQHMGDNIILMENYTATEGNFAYQAVPGVKGMELICNQGIFYEFIPLQNAVTNNTDRITLKDVKPGEQYIMVITNSCGLWAYKLNDIVSFVSVNPFRICVSGRLGDIFSPFGEHLLPLQAERAMATTCKKTNSTIIDFAILPCFNFKEGHRYLCYIEFENKLYDKNIFAQQLHQALSDENSYYEEFKRAGIFLVPDIISVRKNFFKDYLKKNSVQQKNRHLVNDIAFIDIFNKINKAV